jgi:hypothetical protein
MTTTATTKPAFHPASRPSTVRVLGALQVPATAVPTVPRHSPAPAPLDRTEPLPGPAAAQRLHPSGKYRSTVRLRLVS